MLKVFNACIINAIAWVLIILSKKRFYKKGFIFTWNNAIKGIASVLVLLILNLQMVFIKPSDVKLFEGIEEFDFVMPNVYADKVLITVFLGVIISISLNYNFT